MNNKYFQIKTLSLFVVILLVGCDKEPQPKERNTLEHKNYGEQTYLTTTDIPEPAPIDEEKWKRNAKRYLSMKGGDTMIIYGNYKEPQEQSQDNRVVEKRETYIDLVDVKKLDEIEKMKQQRRKIIKERYYIENPNHTWRRVSKKEYLGY